MACKFIVKLLRRFFYAVARYLVPLQRINFTKMQAFENLCIIKVHIDTICNLSLPETETGLSN